MTNPKRKRKAKVAPDCTAQNKKSYELHLDKVAQKICARLGMNLADWQLDSVLENAIRTHPSRESLARLAASYDNLWEVATSLNVPLDAKYKHLHKLMQD